MVILKCIVCGFTQDVPEHCGKPMHGAIRGFMRKKVMLICSNDKCKYALALPIHCGKSMKVV